MIYKYIEECKKNIAKFREELKQAKTKEERAIILDKIADEQQALEGTKVQYQHLNMNEII